MELYLKHLVINLLILFTILHLQGSSSGQECPYPCFPPPTGPGNNPTPTTPVMTPSPPQGGVALYPPPSSYPPGGGGGGVIPYFPPPTGGGDGDGASGMGPPPPEPIVPWFPYYFRKPPHPIESSSIALRGSTAVIAAIVLVAFSMCSVLY